MDLQKKVKHNIVNFEFHYWAEISGAIEHFVKKHNGYYPLPYTMASKILGVPADKIISNGEDKVHYKRMIGTDGDWYIKMISGFKDESSYNKS